MPFLKPISVLLTSLKRCLFKDVKEMITIKYVSLQCNTIDGACVQMNGDRFIVVNSDVDRENRIEAIIHEFAHVRLKHLDSDKSIRTIEAEAENGQNAMW